jgi:hypothetical protein
MTMKKINSSGMDHKKNLSHYSFINLETFYDEPLRYNVMIVGLRDR